MTTPEAQAAPIIHPAEIIEIYDRYLPMAGVLSYSDLVARVEDLERMAALRYAQVYALTVDLTAVATGVYRNTEASLDEAAERAASAAKRGGSFLQQAHAHPDLSNPPENVVLFAAHRIQVVGGRL